MYDTSKHSRTPPLMARGGWLGVVLLVVSVTDAVVLDEHCGALPPIRRCGAMADYVLLVDNSYSMADRAPIPPSNHSA